MSSVDERLSRLDTEGAGVGWFLLLAIGCLLVTHGTCLASASLRDAEAMESRGLKMSLPWRVRVSNWHMWDRKAKVEYVFGVLMGNTIGDSMLGAYDLQPVKIQKKRLYLVTGWNMPTSSYVLETRQQLRESTDAVKSIAASFIRAEARYSAIGDRSQRADRLEICAKDIQYFSSHSNSGLLCKDTDRPDTWHYIEGLGLQTVFIDGLRDGLTLSAVRVHSDVEDYEILFRVGEIAEAMDHRIDEMDDHAGAAQLLLHGVIDLSKAASSQ